MGFLEFQLYVQALCLIHDCSLTSGIRTMKRNDLVGGAETSTHMVDFGFGADIVPDINEPWKRDSILHDARRLGLFALDEGDHVHLGYRIDQG